MTPHPHSRFDPGKGALRDRLLRWCHDNIKVCFRVGGVRRPSTTVLPASIDLPYSAANMLREPPEFIHAVINAIGVISPKEAWDSIVREWPTLVWDEPWERASGEVVCETCGLLYRDHPLSRHRNFQGEPYLHRLCDARLVHL